MVLTQARKRKGGVMDPAESELEFCSGKCLFMMAEDRLCVEYQVGWERGRMRSREVKGSAGC